ncbi:hypothetical protein A8B78_00980 [Jannaschia sp. EhC01]|nr:hypothetical protein A8B78_00980 [Jannaschia sp. EhC01]
MKKVLFATTALIATAGIASADVAISGVAEMGIFGGDTNAGVNQDTQFHTDIDVTFTMSGETDGGITFGAAVDLDENAAFNPADNGGIAIFISGDFGTLTMGDTDGALDFALTEAWVGNAGSIGDNETAHAGALGAYADGLYDGQILRYDYTFDAFSFAVSVELDDAGVYDPGYAVGATYTFSFGGGSATVGAGYQSAVVTAAAGFLPGNLNNAFVGVVGQGTEVEVVGVSAAVALDNGLQAAIQYSDWSFDSGVVGFYHIGVGAGYTFDAITVSANYGMYEGDTAGFWEADGFGVAAAYDFGGGLSAHVGYGSGETFGNTVNNWSLGLAMSF